MPPKISVLLPIYNAEKYLRRTLESLLAQTFSDFEVIAVNDASPDASRDIILSYHDPRICLIENPRNLGQTGALQVGLQRARGEYIARQDQDDVSLPERFERQVAFLDQHPEVGVLGTNYIIIDAEDRVIEGSTPFYAPETISEMAWRLLWTDRLVDSSVMLRRVAAERVGGYDLNYRYAQDFDLWLRLSFEVGVMRLPEVLLQLRIHSTSSSSRFAESQEHEVYCIIQNAINRILPIPTSIETAALFRRMDNGFVRQPCVDIRKAIDIYLTAFKAFACKRMLSLTELISLRRVVAEMLIKIAVRHRASMGLETLILLAVAWSYYPALIMEPATLKAWWYRYNQSKRFVKWLTLNGAKES